MHKNYSLLLCVSSLFFVSHVQCLDLGWVRKKTIAGICWTMPGALVTVQEAIDPTPVDSQDEIEAEVREAFDATKLPKALWPEIIEFADEELVTTVTLPDKSPWDKLVSSHPKHSAIQVSFVDDSTIKVLRTNNTHVYYQLPKGEKIKTQQAGVPTKFLRGLLAPQGSVFVASSLVNSGAASALYEAEIVGSVDDLAGDEEISIPNHGEPVSGRSWYDWSTTKDPKSRTTIKISKRSGNRLAKILGVLLTQWPEQPEQKENEG